MKRWMRCAGTADNAADNMQTVLGKLGLSDENPGVFDGEWRGAGAKIDKISPIDGRRLATVCSASEDDYQKAIAYAQEAFLKWRKTPGPVRGARCRLWRRYGLETFGKNAAHRNCCDKNLRARLS